MSIINQKYEYHWQLTLAKTDFNTSEFQKCLRLLQESLTTAKNYYDQQKYISAFAGLDDAALRKWLNQYTKMNLAYKDDKNRIVLNNYGKKFIVETNPKEKKILISEAIYGARFSEDSEIRNIEFLAKLLKKVGRPITRKEFIEHVFTTKKMKELDDAANDILQNKKNLDNLKLGKRKYNQVSYIFNLLKKIEGFVVRDKKIYLEEMYNTEDEMQNRFLNPINTRGRDSFLQNLFRKSLHNEAGYKCMIWNFKLPVLIASHIKPWTECSNASEAINRNNGLLLNPLYDSLFDEGFISFSDSGSVIYSKYLSKELCAFMNTLSSSIQNKFINDERMTFLKYHRDNLLRKP